MKKTLFSAFILAFLMACEGPVGPAGPPGDTGATGATGANGTNGTNGADGKNSLIITADEPAGDNCATGGTKMSVGVDDNGNGTLDEAEIDEVAYVCNGAGGGAGPKELRFNFNFSMPQSLEDYHQLIVDDFDIANYPGYDSVSLVVDVQVLNNADQTPNNTEHYVLSAINLSDSNAEFDNSATTVNNGKFTSPNFHDDLPEGKFDMAIMGHRVTPGANVYLSLVSAKLILYSKGE